MIELCRLVWLCCLASLCILFLRGINKHGLGAISFVTFDGSAVSFVPPGTSPCPSTTEHVVSLLLPLLQAIDGKMVDECSVIVPFASAIQ